MKTLYFDFWTFLKLLNSGVRRLCHRVFSYNWISTRYLSQCYVIAFETPGTHFFYLFIYATVQSDVWQQLRRFSSYSYLTKQRGGVISVTTVNTVLMLMRGVRGEWPDWFKLPKGSSNSDNHHLQLW